MIKKEITRILSMDLTEMIDSEVLYINSSGKMKSNYVIK